MAKGEMRMSWDYAELSKRAKESGGPEKMMETYGNEKYAEGEEAGRSQGRIEGGIIAAVAGGVVMAGISIGKRIKNRITAKREQRSKEKVNAENAKQTVIEGIKQYDAEQLTANGQSDIGNRIDYQS